MTADFIQTDAKNRSLNGTLALKRPGRIRFDYGSANMLLVGNGKTLTFVDYEVGQKSAWPIAKSPLVGAAVGQARSAAHRPRRPVARIRASCWCARAMRGGPNSAP